jgi:hypothetical protein
MFVYRKTQINCFGKVREGGRFDKETNMGWKASVIIVDKPNRGADEQLLVDLGFQNLSKIGEETFDSVINPDDNKVYIGTYKDNLLICVPELPMEFFNDSETAFERTVMHTFPTSEICAIILHSVVNLWGYAVIKEGKKIRARAGSAEDGIITEYGEPLEEEKELLSKSTIGDEGTRTYMLDGFPDDPFTDDQVGENFVFLICQRYLGEPLDTADDLLYDTKVQGYSFTKVKTKKLQGTESGSKSWWKFW